MSWRPQNEAIVSASSNFECKTFEIWGFAKIRGTLFGGPYKQEYGMLGLYQGSRIYLWKVQVVPTSLDAYGKADA